MQRYQKAGRIPETGGTALAGTGTCVPALTAVAVFVYMVGIGGASCISWVLQTLMGIVGAAHSHRFYVFSDYTLFK